MHARICRWRWRWPRPTAVTVTNSSCQRRRCTRYRRLCIPPSTHYAPSWAVGELWAFPFSTRPTVRLPLPTPHSPLPTSHFPLPTFHSLLIQHTAKGRLLFTSYLPLPTSCNHCSMLISSLVSSHQEANHPPASTTPSVPHSADHLPLASQLSPLPLSSQHPPPTTSHHRHLTGSVAAILAKEVAAVDALERSLPPVEGPRMASQVTQWVRSPQPTCMHICSE